jgi:glucose dehydrogenase
MNKWLEILVGLVLVIGTIIIVFEHPSYLSAALVVLKGGVLWALFGIGILFILLGISELKG